MLARTLSPLASIPRDDVDRGGAVEDGLAALHYRLEGSGRLAEMLAATQSFVVVERPVALIQLRPRLIPICVVVADYWILLTRIRRFTDSPGRVEPVKFVKLTLGIGVSSQPRVQT